MSTAKGYTHYNGVKIPSSHSVKMVLCGDPSCKAVHLIAHNRFGLPFAEMTMDADLLDKAQGLLKEDTR